MTKEEIEEILDDLRQAKADTAHIEVKRASDRLPKRLWETLSAFSNTPGGGVVVLGVDEAGAFHVTGLSNPGKLQADLASMCDQMVPPVRPLIEVLRVAGHSIVVAQVPEILYKEKPCYYGPSGLLSGSYTRVGDGDRRLTQYEIQALLDRRRQPEQDVESLTDATVQDLDRELLQRFLRRVRDRRGRRWQEMHDEEVLRAFRIVTVQDNKTVPTLAGYLCFGMYPQDRFPNLCVTFVRYPTRTAGEPGPEGERFLDNEKLVGPIPVMVAESLRAAKRNMRRRGVIRGLYREDFWEYPEAALREAIVNALGHRDYGSFARGSHVQIRMFPDRLTVASPGGLFGPVTVDDLGHLGIQASRNQYLMNILEDLPGDTTNAALCEQRGSGIAAMLGILQKAGMEAPEFHDRITSFEVTFFSATPIEDEYRYPLPLDWNTGPPKLYDSRARAVDVPSSAGRADDTGRIRAGRRPTMDERVGQALRLTGEASVAELAQIIGVSHSSVRLALRKLMRQSAVVATTSSPNSPRRRYRWHRG